MMEDVGDDHIDDITVTLLLHLIQISAMLRDKSTKKQIHNTSTSNHVYDVAEYYFGHKKCQSRESF